MRTNLEVARRTFVKPLSTLQIAATEVLPQGISVALSIRELIRQGYLYSAAILLRPLIERAGTIHYLRSHPRLRLGAPAGRAARNLPSMTC